MKTNRERNYAQRGNALIYVLIGIALFAALSFVLSRQGGGGSGESSGISDDKASLYATQMISYATQTKQTIDQMVFSGSNIDNLDFTPPSDPTFDAGTTRDHIYKVYHPDGGGLIPGKLPDEAIKESDTNPKAGWYLNRFNNVDWSKTSANDVILVAYQIRPEVCTKIDAKLGVSTIPTMSATIKSVMIKSSEYTSGTNTNLTTAPGQICPECKNRASLCVQEGGMYAFYTIVADQ